MVAPEGNESTMKSCWGWWSNPSAKGQLRSLILGYQRWKGRRTDGSRKQGLLCVVVVFGASIKPTGLIFLPYILVWISVRRGLQAALLWSALILNSAPMLVLSPQRVAKHRGTGQTSAHWLIKELRIRIWNCPMYSVCHYGLGEVVGAELIHIFANTEPKWDPMYCWEH